MAAGLPRCHGAIFFRDRKNNHDHGRAATGIRGRADESHRQASANGIGVAGCREDQSFSRWTASSPSLNRALSTFLSYFPTVVLGISVMNVQFSGTCQRATLPSR